ncbi:MAG: hypothetical protein IJ120_08175 [Solobacterium sp.]|nr:hypothetical protein [Solobacterium sp.]
MTQKKSRSSARQSASAAERNRKKINGALAALLLVLALIVTGAFAVNIARVLRNNTSAASDKPAETIAPDTGKQMKNDLYTIGNNPTDLEKDEFQKLTDSIGTADDAAVAEAVARNFVADYFTWTNKDGNYEIGGLQYIYGGKVAVFEQWSRYNFYKDFDLYITQYGRKKLIEVATVTTDKPVEKAPDFVTYDFKDNETKIELKYPCYEVNLSWTYVNNGAETTAFPTGARFFVANNEGRWEIVEFYDYESIREWEASQGN